MSPHVECQLSDGHEFEDGQLIRIKVTDDEGGCLGEAVCQILDASRGRWPKVKYLCASDEGVQWYIDKPGGAARVPKPARLHLCSSQPSLCNKNHHDDVQHFNQWLFLTRTDAKALAR